VRLCIAVSVGLPIVCQAGAGSAQTAAGSDESVRLGRELSAVAATGRRERFTNLATAAASGGVLLPFGIALSQRDDEVLRLIGVGWTVAGSVQLSGAPFLLLASPMERVSARFEERRQGGASSPALVAETEREWAAAANQSRAVRLWFGGVYGALGAAMVPTGLTFLFASPGIFGMSRTTQYDWGSALVGAGVPFVTVALQMLLRESLAETSWEAHVLARSPQARSAFPAFSAEPGPRQPARRLVWNRFLVLRDLRSATGLVVVLRRRQSAGRSALYPCGVSLLQSAIERDGGAREHGRFTQELEHRRPIRALGDVLEDYLRELLCAGVDRLVPRELLGRRRVVGKDVVGIEVVAHAHPPAMDRRLYGSRHIPAPKSCARATLRREAYRELAASGQRDQHGRMHASHEPDRLAHGGPVELIETLMTRVLLHAVHAIR
jgi:hypothetical protein